MNLLRVASVQERPRQTSQEQRVEVHLCQFLTRLQVAAERLHISDKLGLNMAHGDKLVLLIIDPHGGIQVETLEQRDRKGTGQTTLAALLPLQLRVHGVAYILAILTAQNLRARLIDVRELALDVALNCPSP